ncbi:4-(cytidine 5'-diphospho)-2-C-methyl-D-erythritol kinase [uncultured Bacteroides sp.]|uniref:4-(cytidine 5'-diphospho)-2-C-methyl-D-erythritol kinase n=1 Tax=uncultured Bacteroides sp. TaxID=162156 RepID=UPI002610CEB2|nr:4-(cytidine 5'-diphospho)-2-C-methyl-D-erythritol kinase [uncultured Bacteroides sp.]
MITFPNAKINLGLNIVEKRPDGYHNLETVFYPINIQDGLEVNRLTDSNEPYRLSITGTAIEGDPDQNLVVKAYKLLKEKYDMAPVDIHLFKHIPTGAGLGGGSADCAFMIKVLNEKFRLGMSFAEMEDYAARLGADCAFFIQNQPVFATGIGNIFERINLSLNGYHIVLVKPDIFVSTKDAFANIRPKRPEMSLKEIVKQPIETWKDTMKNDFEDSVFLKFPEIAAIKDKMYDLGAIYAAMSGSGASVYGLFKNPVENVDKIFAGCFCRQREMI